MTAGRKIISQSQQWCTPRKYVTAIHDFFAGAPDLDPCSNVNSIVEATTEYVLPRQDGLKESWKFKKIYVNPPYGREKSSKSSIYDWLQRCHEAHSQNKSEVLALVPVATNTAHWKEFVFGQAAAVCFLADTRLKFLVAGTEQNKGAPMSCCMIYWGKDLKRFQKVFAEFGAIVPVKEAYSTVQAHRASPRTSPRTTTSSRNKNRV